MKEILIVGIGGCIGAVARYKIGGLVMHHTSSWKIPAGTMAVNIAGCLIAGILMALAVRHDYFKETTRLLMFTGILGGFTTFSAFGLDTVFLIQKQEFAWAAIYSTGTVIFGILVLWLAFTAVK
jgi:CrcB protein